MERERRQPMEANTRARFSGRAFVDPHALDDEEPLNRQRMWASMDAADQGDNESAGRRLFPADKKL